MYLLDTNVVSEPKRQAPDGRVLTWLSQHAPSDLYVSALTIGELRRGVLGLDPGARRNDLTAWIDDAVTMFAERILAVDTPVAEAWAQLSRRHRLAGLTVGAVDELLAATALAHDLTLVTRNLRHFEGSGCRLLSPWDA
jgi:predicted nucleic acid-binding protein